MGDRVIKQYLGAGERAISKARFAALERAVPATQNRAWQEEQTQLDAADALTASLDSLVNQVVREVLTAAGFHQHHRGAWRRRRTA
jgi:hypothetical protein